MYTSITHIQIRNQHFRQLIIKFAVVWLYSTNTPRPNAYITGTVSRNLYNLLIPQNKINHCIEHKCLAWTIIERENAVHHINNLSAILRTAENASLNPPCHMATRFWISLSNFSWSIKSLTVRSSSDGLPEPSANLVFNVCVNSHDQN